MRLRIWVTVLLMLSMLFTMSSCISTPKAETKTFYSMGSLVSVTVYDSSIPDGMSSKAARLENQISYKISESLIASANRGESVLVDGLLREALDTCAALTAKTSGAFDLTVQPVSSLWCFDEAPAVPSASDIALALEKIGWEEHVSFVDGRLSLGGAAIDMGAVGKGLACDLLVNELSEKGICGIVSVGGSIGVCVDPEKKDTFTIGIRDPFSSAQSDIMAKLLLRENLYVSTSGTYEKFFEEDGKYYHHILDATTGYPVDNDLVSVTVVAENGYLSDALSTALLLVGTDEGIAICKEHGAQALFIGKDGRAVATEGMRSILIVDQNLEVEYQ